jgi:hypothetical protein
MIGGQRLLLSGGGDGGVHAFKVRTGEKVWSYYFGSGAINCSPVVDGDRIYIGHGDENPDSNEQGRVICLNGAKVTDGVPELVWQRDGIKVKFASPILDQGRLYVCDEVARLYCLDASTGKSLWKRPFAYGRNCMGSPVLAEGKVYVGEVQSKFHILKPGADKCERLHAHFFQSPPGVTADIELNGGPAVANNRVYFSTSEGTYCIGKPQRPSPVQVDTIAVPGGAGEPKVGGITHLQVIPADVTLLPGASQQFKVRAFDDKGRFVKEVKAEWSLAPAPPPPPAPGTAPAPATTPPAKPPVLQGKITESGELTVAKAPPGQFGLVVASAEGLTGSARIRVAPTLPFQPNFSNIPVGRAPGGWVNAQGKFVMAMLNGAPALMKTNTVASPLVSRAYTYLGKPTATDYTIQVDTLGTKKGPNMPDTGLLANRYTLLLDGNKQSLRLHSWDALPRIDKTLAYPWKPDTWYTLKLTVAVNGDKALVRGKVWPSEQSEPKEWTIEVEDPTPNREGSPGLYGLSTGILENEPGATSYYRNVVVTPNKK